MLEIQLTSCAGARTITSDQTVHNNSSLSSSSRQYDITGWKLLRSDKFIIWFVFWVIFEYSNFKLRKYCNLGTENSRRAWNVVSAQEVDDRVWDRRIARHSNFVDISVAVDAL